MKSNKFKLILLLIPMTLILTGCDNSPITENPSGIWDWLVYGLAQLIIVLGKVFGNNVGWGIVASTIVFRVLMIPLFRKQTQSTAKMQEVQPEIKKINEKYKNKKDRETQAKKNQEIQALYKRHGVNPLSGCLPLLLQMPLLFAYYDAVTGLLINGKYDDTTDVAYQGLINLGAGDMTQQLLGFDLAEPVIFFAIIAAVTTYFSSKLSMAGQNKSQANDMMKSMTIVMPIMIFVMGITLPGALSIYWATSNSITIAQTAYFKRDVLFNTNTKAINKK